MYKNMLITQFHFVRCSYVADRATTKGLANDYTSETIQGLTYNYAGGTQNIGVVSVGNVDGTRRIQNVAPALISSTSTDAVNGSQLYDTNRALGNVAKSVANLIGGNYTINPDARYNSINLQVILITLYKT